MITVIMILGCMVRISVLVVRVIMLILRIGSEGWSGLGMFVTCAVFVLVCCLPCVVVCACGSMSAEVAAAAVSAVAGTGVIVPVASGSSDL